MRWDDVQILRQIHELENGESGFLLSGYSLMEKIRPSVPTDPIRDANLFAKELLLARSAGCVDFNDQAYSGPLANPASNGHLWLQQIRDISLTLPGRDRALGRLVIANPPDPSEDDGRNIASLTLQEIADAIGATYSPRQVEAFLTDSGLTDEYLAQMRGSSSAELMQSLLENLNAGGSAARRLLRTFLGSWLSNRLHSWPDLATRRKVMTHLAQQGWHLRGDRLIVGEQLPAPDDPHVIQGPIVATVVRTDIAGSTQLRKSMGEAPWSDLRDEHYTSLRRLLEDYRGTEINDLGDGLLIWFASPVGAVRFATAAVDEAVKIQLTIRVAIDTGECRLLDPTNDLDGLPLARVERLAARTAPGEVLISDSVRPLVRGLEPFQTKNVELPDFGPMIAYVVGNPGA